MDTKIIVHISGASGSGKTFLGNRLKENINNNYIIKDLDELRDEFINKFYGNKKWTYINEKEYQQYINNFINKQNKSIVFVGLNDNTIYGKNKKLYYNLYSQYNYYIEIDNITLIKQKCLRLLNNIQYDKFAINELINNNEMFIKKLSQGIKKECNIKENIKLNTKWKKYYMKQGYNLMSRENIYTNVIKLFNK